MVKSGWTSGVRRRVVLLFWALVLVFVALFGRLFALQHVLHDRYYALARAQQEGEIVLHALRGDIRDRNGQPLAKSMARTSVAVNPLQVKDIRGTALTLGSILKTDPAYISRVLRRGGTFAWIQRKVPDVAAQQVEKMKLPGVFLVQESTGRRFYPKGRLAAHLLGATGIDDQGLDGIEASHENYLAGTPGTLKAVLDRDGWRMPTDNTIKKAQPGKHLLLTIDETIQYVAERELAKQVKEFQAKGGICVVMDAKTADILALAIQPDFPADRFSEVKPELRRNRAVTDPYEPGSTFKVFTAAAALNSGVEPGSVFSCPGTIGIDGWTIHNANDGLNAGGAETLTDIVVYSFNTGTANVALQIGKEKLGKTLDAFGFGHRTGVGFQGEEPGLLSEWKDWEAINTATISFGQSVAVTPLQLVSAMQAVANDGVRLQPRIVRAVVDDDGRTLERFEPKKISQPMSKEAARKLNSILQQVCARGTGKGARIPGYLVAGKTGTAQVVENGGYSGGKFIGSFLGFAPADDPRLVILVKIEEPGTVYWGGVVAAPVFSRVARQALWKLGVRPTPNLVQKAPNE